MGLLQKGKWIDQWYDTKSHEGRFVRQDAKFRNWVTSDGRPGPTGDGGFRAETGRYHLYVAYACPWAHRTLIFLTLKGLETFISLSFVDWYMGKNGWTFRANDPFVGDKLYKSQFLYEVYLKAEPNYTGRVTVPVLWDIASEKIVSNESADIIRMMNSEFDAIGATPADYYPKALRNKINKINSRIYHCVNNGVYKAGFSTTQEAYEVAVNELFETLDWLNSLLDKQRYLAGAKITEADWRLFTTLIRFDLVYTGHFKCNKKSLQDYPVLQRYVSDLYNKPGIKETLHIEHIKKHYYGSHPTINPTGIIPVGPNFNYS